jgi:hypothetical protein
MLLRITQFSARQGSEQRLFEFLKWVIAPVVCSLGCISCRVLRESDNLAQMAVIEEWTTLESLGWAAKAVPSEVMRGSEKPQHYALTGLRSGHSTRAACVLRYEKSVFLSRFLSEMKHIEPSWRLVTNFVVMMEELYGKAEADRMEKQIRRDWPGSTP